MSTKTPARPKNTKKPRSEPTATPADLPESPKKVNGWVKAFVAFHVFAITVWSIPSPPQSYLNGAKWKLETNSIPAFTQSLNDGFRLFNTTQLHRSPVQYYLLASGFWQYWDMFAPNPANVDFYCDADVIYADGSHRTYEYPRMANLGLIQKYGMERFRKYYERSRDDAYQFTWPAFAQRVALLSTTDPSNPPVEVRLIRHWLEVAPPGKPQGKEYNKYEYLRYSVDQDKLRRDLAGGE